MQAIQLEVTELAFGRYWAPATIGPVPAAIMVSLDLPVIPGIIKL